MGSACLLRRVLLLCPSNLRGKTKKILSRRPGTASRRYGDIPKGDELLELPKIDDGVD